MISATSTSSRTAELLAELTIRRLCKENSVDELLSLWNYWMQRPESSKRRGLIRLYNEAIARKLRDDS